MHGAKHQQRAGERSDHRRRVALFRTSFLHYSETFIHDELRCHRRWLATVFCRQRTNAQQFRGHEVFAVEELPNRPRPLESALFALTARNPRLERAFAARRFELVHAHFGHNGLYALPFSRRAGLPLVVSLHGRDVSVLTGPDRTRLEWIYYSAQADRLFRETTLFIAASTELKQLIVGAGCPEHKVRVHLLGIDLEAFQPSPSPVPDHGPAQLVMVGRFVEKKGFRYGIEALARAVAAGHDARLTIIGDGPLEDELTVLAGRLGVAGRVVFPGFLPHDRVAEAVAGATVVLTPSVVAKNHDRESGLIVAKEASACAVPVIGTIHGGIPDIIDDGVTGYLVPERDSEALADRLCRVLADPRLRTRLGRAARRKMEREYDLHRQVERLEQIYDVVAARRPGNDPPRTTARAAE